MRAAGPHTRQALLMNLNPDKSWSEMDLAELRETIAHGCSIEEAADALCRELAEVWAKADELGLSAPLT
jgi:hypothetical protein